MNPVLRCAGALLALTLVLACGEKKNASPNQGEHKAPAPPTANPEAAAPPTAPVKVPTRASLGQELGGLMETFGHTIVSVSDRPTWEQAKTELARVEARIIAITAELKTLSLPSPAERQLAIQAMKQNEERLEAALGNKNTFMQRLPADVAAELGEAARTFSMKMGQAQQTLYGNANR